MKSRLLFFFGVCAIALHFSIQLGIESTSYFSLQKKVKAQITQWEIVEIKGKYGLKADYTFEVQKKSLSGAFLLNPPYYLNENAALSALKKRAKENWAVWYNPKKLSISALEKSFPTELLIKTVICYGVIIYFFRLNRSLSAI